MEAFLDPYLHVTVFTVLGHSTHPPIYTYCIYFWNILYAPREGLQPIISGTQANVCHSLWRWKRTENTEVVKWQRVCWDLTEVKYKGLYKITWQGASQYAFFILGDGHEFLLSSLFHLTSLLLILRGLLTNSTPSSFCINGCLEDGIHFH